MPSRNLKIVQCNILPKFSDSQYSKISTCSINLAFSPMYRPLMKAN